MKFKFIQLLVLPAFLLLLTCGCGVHNVIKTRTFYSMGTVITANVEFPQGQSQQALETLDKIAAAVGNIDSYCNTSVGELFEINSGGGGNAVRELYELLRRSKTYAEETDGAFDPTLGALITLWGMDDFTNTDSFTPPTDEAIKAVKYGYQNLTFEGDNYVRLSDGVKLNLGAVAKGRACDAAAEILRQSACETAVLDFGGSVVFYSTAAQKSTRKLGVVHPKNDGQVLLDIDLSKLTKDGRYGKAETVFAVTSGSYRRFFEYNGKKYHHILDPATGYPGGDRNNSVVASVTVIGTDSVTAEYCDALSTALFVMGAENGLDFIRHKGIDVSVIFVAEDGKIYVSDDVNRSSVRTLDGAYSFTDEAQTAEISRNGELIQTIPLDTDSEYKVSGYNGGYNIITVKSGRICVSEADCPEQLCVHSGERGRGLANENRLPIICLPHRIEIVVK